MAVFLATLAVVFGLATIFLTGVSYSDNFSSVFRAARGAKLSEMLREEDSDGHDPLPRYLARAEVSFGRTIDKDR